MNRDAGESANRIREVVQSLIGLRFSIARNAGDMKVLHFGETKRVKKGLVGQYALHIQCPWRLTSEQSVVTGSGDFHPSAGCDSGEPPETGEPHLQDRLLRRVLGGYDEQTRSQINTGGSLTVISVNVTRFGDLQLHLSGGYDIELFVSGSSGEQWRIFTPGDDKPHLVVADSTARYE